MNTTTPTTSFRLTLGLLVCCLAALPAGADDFYVNTLSDTYDEYCTILAYPPWSCSLREALTIANDTPGKDTIHLQPGTYVLSRVGFEDLNVTGDLDILDDVDIKGAGAGITVIDGNWTDRVFHAPSRAPEVTAVQLFDLTVQNGTVHPASAELPGGGILVRLGDLFLWRCEVRSNLALAGSGHGIYAQSSTLLIVDSTIADNGPLVPDLNSSAGGIYLGGGTMLVVRSTFHSNRADQASAIKCDGAVLNTVNTTFADNVGLRSGVLRLVDCDTVIDSTTFSGNQPYAIAGSNATGPGVLTLRNTYIDDGCNFIDINFFPTSDGANVCTDFSCSLTHPTDVEPYAPNQVGPLGDHGGHTWTMLPLTLTILMDNPDADANCQPEDQRGVSRPQEGYYSLACDIGAVELRPEDLIIIFTDGFESGNTSAWQ